MNRVNQRVAYWEAQIQKHVPKGTRITDAQAYFRLQGRTLHCCMSGSDIKNAYYALDRNVGRFAFAEYSVQIVADVDSDQRATRVRVLRIGVGL